MQLRTFLGHFDGMSAVGSRNGLSELRCPALSQACRGSSKILGERWRRAPKRLRTGLQLAMVLGWVSLCQAGPTTGQRIEALSLVIAVGRDLFHGV